MARIENAARIIIDLTHNITLDEYTVVGIDELNLARRGTDAVRTALEQHALVTDFHPHRGMMLRKEKQQREGTATLQPDNTDKVADAASDAPPTIDNVADSVTDAPPTIDTSPPPPPALDDQPIPPSTKRRRRILINDID